MKLNNRAFSAVEGLLALIAITLIAFTGYYVYHAQKTANDTLNSAAKDASGSPRFSSKKTTAASNTTKDPNLDYGACLGSHLQGWASIDSETGSCSKCSGAANTRTGKCDTTVATYAAPKTFSTALIVGYNKLTGDTTKSAQTLVTSIAKDIFPAPAGGQGCGAQPGYVTVDSVVENNTYIVLGVNSNCGDLMHDILHLQNGSWTKVCQTHLLRADSTPTACPGVSLPNSIYS